MGRRQFAAVALAAMLCASACGAEAATGGAPQTSSIDGIRSDADHQGLVASYVGGACDGPAQLAVNETSARIDVSIIIEPDPNAGNACAAVGYLRTVAARLRRPIGSRAIWSTGTRLIPLDGKRLLVPSDLPAGFTHVSERGWSDQTVVPQPVALSGSSAVSTVVAPITTTSWSRTYSGGDPGPDSDHCTPARGGLTIRQEPAGANDFADGWIDEGRTTVGVAPAHRWRQNQTNDPNGPVLDWAVSWTVGSESVVATADSLCTGDHLLTPPELLQVARSLKSG